MKCIEYDQVVMLAARLKHLQTLTEEVGDKPITMSLRTLQRIVRTRFNKSPVHVGRGGHPPHVREGILKDYVSGKYSVAEITRRAGVARLTTQRYINKYRGLPAP